MSYSDQLQDYGLTIELDGESLIVSPAELVTREVANLIRAHKQAIVAELTGANQWTGEAADLVEWFNVNRHRLPFKPFTLEYWPDGEAMVIVGVPAAYYRELGAAIDEGPAGPRAEQLVSILGKLKRATSARGNRNQK